MCDKTKINFALCVEDEADCDNPEYDYHFYKSKDGEKDAVKITYFLKSRKHENKWYTSLIIEKINIIAKRPEQLMVDLDTGELY